MAAGKRPSAPPTSVVEQLLVLADKEPLLPTLLQPLLVALEQVAFHLRRRVETVPGPGRPRLQNRLENSSGPKFDHHGNGRGGGGGETLHRSLGKRKKKKKP